MMNDFDPKNLNVIREMCNSYTGFGIWDCLAKCNRGPEYGILYAKALWPDFTEVGGFILLTEQLEGDHDYFERVLRENGPGYVEATVNTVYLENLFGTGDSDYPDEVWEGLGDILCQTWKARAMQLFADASFVTAFEWYSEDPGDPGVSIQQAKWLSLQKRDPE